MARVKGEKGEGGEVGVAEEEVKEEKRREE